MADIKLKDLYLPKDELKDIMQLVANKRNIKNYKSKSSDKLYEIFKKQCKNKERIDNIREDLKDLSYKLSKSELKEIKIKRNYVQYESKGDKISIPEYLALIEKYLRKLINQCKREGEWKIQLTAEINFISLKPGSDETRIMYTRSDNEESMNGDDTNEIIKELFKSFL